MLEMSLSINVAPRRFEIACRILAISNVLFSTANSIEVASSGGLDGCASSGVGLEGVIGISARCVDDSSVEVLRNADEECSS